MTLSGRRLQELRYGENPHQRAAVYAGGEARPGVATATQLQGKPLSYNNLNDTDAAFELAAEFTEPTIAIIKHANPCGVASAADLGTAWQNALAADPVSAFGGIVAANMTLDAETARAITGIFTEVVIAPDADDEARAILLKSRISAFGHRQYARPGSSRSKAQIGERRVPRPVPRQRIDHGSDLRIVTKAQPDAGQIDDMMFAWRVCKHEIERHRLASDRCTVGVGAGQMSRVICRIAAQKARDTPPIMDGTHRAPSGRWPPRRVFPLPTGLRAD